MPAANALMLKLAGYGAVTAICSMTVMANVAFAVTLGTTAAEKVVFGARARPLMS